MWQLYFLTWPTNFVYTRSHFSRNIYQGFTCSNNLVQMLKINLNLSCTTSGWKSAVLELYYICTPHHDANGNNPIIEEFVWLLLQVVVQFWADDANILSWLQSKYLGFCELALYNHCSHWEKEMPWDTADSWSSRMFRLLLADVNQ